MIAYKAFYPGLKSFNGMQFETGKTYRVENKGIAKGGFHAAADPMFCLGFVQPRSGGIYHEVDISGITDRGELENGACGHYSAMTGERLRIGRRLSVEEMLSACMSYRLAQCVRTEDGKGSGYGIKVVNESRFGTAYVRGTLCTAVAAEEDSEAFASGERCTAIAEGDCSSAMIEDACSRNCLAVAKGRHSRIGGCYGTWLLFLNEDKPLYACVGTDGIRPDTYYTLINGKIEKAS